MNKSPISPNPELMTRGKRHSRYTRSDDPPAMVLMPRDLGLLAHLARYRRLTSQQIKMLVPFGSDQTAGYRLQRLWQHGYVERDFWHVTLGSAPAVYRLGKRGARALAAQLGADADVQGVVDATRDHYFLDHTLAVNDVLIAFEVAALRACHQVTWSVPAKPLDRLPDPLQLRDIVPVLPDATILYLAGDRKMQAFLEVDRGTESSSRFSAKVRGYLAYLESGNYHRHYGLRTFRLLVVAPGEKRLSALQTAVVHTIAKTAARVNMETGACLGLIWWAVQGDVRPATVLQDIWNANGHRATFFPAQLTTT